MSYDSRIFRGSRDAVGAPGDDAAVNATEPNTMISLLKGLYVLLDGTIDVSAPGGSTEAKQDDAIAVLGSILAKLSSDPATNTGLAAILAKLSADPATQTTLAAVLAKLSGDPATQTTLAAVLAKISGDPATQTTLAAVLTKLNASIAVTGTFWQTTQPVSLAAIPALVAGSALIGRAVADASAATGGIATTARLLSAAGSTNATSAKGSAGRLYAVQGYNAANAVRFLKLYDKASAPTVGTDTPVKTLALPPGVGFAFDWPLGYSFATGIAFALTTGGADNDTGALTAADVVGLNLDYA